MIPPAWRATVTASTARGLSIGASLALTMVVAWSLPVDQAGRFYVAFALINGCATAGRLGTDNLAVKLVASKPRRARSTAAHCLAILIVASAFCAAACYALVPSGLRQSAGSRGGAEAAWASVAVVPAAASVLVGALFRATDRVAIGTFAELGSTAAIASIGLGIFHAAGAASLGTALAIYALASLATCVWALPLAWHRLTKEVGGEDTPPSLAVFWHQHLGSLISFMVTSLGFYLLTWVPVIVLGLMGAPSAAAYYNVAARICGLLTLIPAIQVSYLSPRFARDSAVGQSWLITQAARRAMLVATAAAAPVIFAALVIPSSLLRLFGSAYPAAGPTLQWLALGTFLTLLAGPANAIVMTCGHERFAGRLVALLFVGSVFGCTLAARSGPSAVAAVVGLLGAAYAWTCALMIAADGISATPLLRPSTKNIPRDSTRTEAHAHDRAIPHPRHLP